MTRDRLPTAVLNLYRREREIAEIVFGQGEITAKCLQACLSDPLTSGAVRSMLNRLVRKGVLARRREEESSEYLYCPAVTRSRSREHAVRQLADDFFNGSVVELAACVRRLSSLREAA